MSFNMPTSQGGYRVAGAIIQLGREIAASDAEFTFLGALGDVQHTTEGYQSDHNPFILGPDGKGVIRAIDIGGPDAKLKALRQHLWDLYAAQDNRVYAFGYMKGTSDNQINNWYLPFGHHTDSGDAGHLHISVTQKNGNAPSPSGYVAAIDDTRSWGISSGVVTSGGGVVLNSPPAAGTKYGQGAGVPAIIARGSGRYLGSLSGPANSLGGANANEKAAVQLLQRRLIACGFVPGQTDPNSGWADGIYDTPQDKPNTGATSQAVARFQHAYMPGTTFYGQCWWDDWTKLFSL